MSINGGACGGRGWDRSHLLLDRDAQGALGLAAAEGRRRQQLPVNPGCQVRSYQMLSRYQGGLTSMHKMSKGRAAQPDKRFDKRLLTTGGCGSGTVVMQAQREVAGPAEATHRRIHHLLDYHKNLSTSTITQRGLINVGLEARHCPCRQVLSDAPAGTGCRAPTCRAPSAR
jgi:hypothetical protein